MTRHSYNAPSRSVAAPGTGQPADVMPPQAEPERPNTMTQQILNEITGPLIEHIRDQSLTGRDFADCSSTGSPAPIAADTEFARTRKS
jgi:hypothetical protein